MCDQSGHVSVTQHNSATAGAGDTQPHLLHFLILEIRLQLPFTVFFIFFLAGGKPKMILWAPTCSSGD